MAPASAASAMSTFAASAASAFNVSAIVAADDVVLLPLQRRGGAAPRERRFERAIVCSGRKREGRAPGTASGGGPPRAALGFVILPTEMAEEAVLVRGPRRVERIGEDMATERAGGRVATRPNAAVAWPPSIARRGVITEPATPMGAGLRTECAAKDRLRRAFVGRRVAVTQRAQC